MSGGKVFLDYNMLRLEHSQEFFLNGMDLKRSFLITSLPKEEKKTAIKKE